MIRSVSAGNFDSKAEVDVFFMDQRSFARKELSKGKRSLSRGVNLQIYYLYQRLEWVSFQGAGGQHHIILHLHEMQSLAFPTAERAMNALCLVTCCRMFKSTAAFTPGSLCSNSICTIPSSRFTFTLRYCNRTLMSWPHLWRSRYALWDGFLTATTVTTKNKSFKL